MIVQQAKVADPSLTPSAQLLEQLLENRESFSRFALRQSLGHAELFRRKPVVGDELAHFEALAQRSLQAQRDLEQQDSVDFDSFVRAYQDSLATPPSV